MEYAQRPRSALLAQILQRMQQNQQFQPQSYGALAAGLGAALLDKRAYVKEQQRLDRQEAGDKSALVRALSQQPESIQLDTLGGDPIQMQQTRQNPMVQALAGGLPNEALQGLAAQKLASQMFPPQEEAYTLGEGDIRFVGNKPIARGAPKADARQKKTEDVAIGGGLWQKFEVRQDGTVDMERPIGEPFSSTPSASRINVNQNLPPQEEEFEKELGKSLAKSVMESKGVADESVEVINTVHAGRKLLDSGIISGFGADYIVGFGKALQQIGFNVGEDAISNTEAFAANMAQNVGKIIKQFGAGTGLSDADREYAQKMAGGQITLNEQSIRKILDINERASRNLIERHNKKVKGLESKIPLEVVAPAYMGAGPAPAGIDPALWNEMTDEERELFRGGNGN